MKPSPFKYVAPRSLDEALTLLAEYGEEAKCLAGGQSLGPLLNLRLAAPEVLIDLRHVDSLREFDRRPDGSFAIGAMCTQRFVEEEGMLGGSWPAIGAALRHVAHPPIRNRGTIGGSIAHADPAAELPAVMSAVGATFRIASKRGIRQLPVAEFFISHFSTALEPDEILTHVVVPPPSRRSGQSWIEFAPRHGDFAIVGVAVVVQLTDEGLVDQCRVAVSGVAGTPVIAPFDDANSVSPNELGGSADAWAKEFAARLDFVTDNLGSADYRRRLTAHLVAMSVREAVARCE